MRSEMVYHRTKPPIDFTGSHPAGKHPLRRRAVPVVRTTCGARHGASIDGEGGGKRFVEALAQSKSRGVDQAGLDRRSRRELFMAFPSRALSLEEVDGRNLPTKLRDGIARLFSPDL